MPITDNIVLNLGPRSRVTVAAALQNWLTYNGEIEGVETLAEHEVAEVIALLLGTETPPPDQVRPVVVIVRHPEMEDQTWQFTGVGVPQIIYLDLGSSFDITRPTEADDAEVRSWLEATEAELAQLPSDHPAREVIAGTISEVREAFDLDDADAS